MNGGSAHTETKVETLKREIDPASEPVYFFVKAVLYTDVANTFDTLDDAFDFATELGEVFPVDLPGCNDIALDESPTDNWTITIPISISFSMPKALADILSDHDIANRLQAELCRLAGTFRTLPTSDALPSSVLRGVFGVLITDMWRDP